MSFDVGERLTGLPGRSLVGKCIVVCETSLFWMPAGVVFFVTVTIKGFLFY